MPHMIVLFVIVLIVFGPHKLPELARGLGKLMAEFRKASTDFKSSFEQEMRDMERQALQVERKKAAEAAAASANAPDQAATLATPSGAETPSAALEADTRITDTLVITPVAESVPRSSEDLAEVPTEPSTTSEAPAVAVTEPSQDPSHDHQQPV